MTLTRHHCFGNCPSDAADDPYLLFAGVNRFAPASVLSVDGPLPAAPGTGPAHGAEALRGG